MAEQRLDAAQIRPPIQEMSRETMPQFMRTNDNRNGGLSKVPPQREPNRARRNTCSRFVDEQWSIVDLRRRAISLDSLQRRDTYRTNTLLSTFAEDARRFGVMIDVGHIQRSQLAQPQAAAVKELENRDVTIPHPFGCLFLGCRLQWRR